MVRFGIIHGAVLMGQGFIDLPYREVKPRNTGLTLLLDKGASTRRFVDVIQAHQSFIDLVKFGWGTALITAELETKVECLKSHGVQFFFGGTLFEKAFHQRKLPEFYNFLKSNGCQHVEISNGTVDLPNEEKCKIITEFAREFYVFSEVGYKDSDKSQRMYPAKWVEYIGQDLSAGAAKVICEARECGTSGICHPNGELRIGLIEQILNSLPALDRVIFEAPTRSLQAYFVKRCGPNVNLGNIALDDVLALETLRLGLRADNILSIRAGIRDSVGGNFSQPGYELKTSPAASTTPCGFHSGRV